MTKAARYGIKIYVIADATTAYVLHVLVYTGQYTYLNTSNDSEEVKKTVKVVKELCKQYTGSHRIVFIDRFYTSLDLVKELESMGLYTTGTCMSNRIPSELCIKKQSKEFKDMDQGDFKQHLYRYTKAGGSQSELCLICWKDQI